MKFIDVFDFSKYFKREGDAKRAKIGHVNEVIEQLSYTETIIDISSAEILTMGTNPVVLLPAPGVGKYYEVRNVHIEFTAGLSNYTLGGGTIPYIFISLNAVANMFLQKAFITTSGNKMFNFNHFEGGLDTLNVLNYQYNGTAENKAVEFKTWSNINPANGDGTLRVKIYHKTITFGA